ncbi:hypothetical protein K7X08_035818 [Anisodus acutangulus]|uniref:Uncharacterized protein n=1 Tax=Anisodus acutangulus TaxID=402998 RepID=A0A9Q1L411_9SOLA|nr:hypothetical protein K7X08_035818 [Anisodus acutangulus]
MFWLVTKPEGKMNARAITSKPRISAIICSFTNHSQQYDDHEKFFKTLCVTQRHVLRILASIIPWILPIAGLSVLARIVLFPSIFVLLLIELRRRHLSILMPLKVSCMMRTILRPFDTPTPT